MRVRVLLFGRLKELGAAEREVEVRAGDSVGDLVRGLPGLPAELLQRSAVAVNHEYVSWETTLRDGDEVAVLPPVSGGLR